MTGRTHRINDLRAADHVLADMEAIGRRFALKAILLLRHRNDHVSLAYQWASGDGAAMRPVAGGRPTLDYPRFRERLYAGSTVRIDDAAALGDAWSSEASFLSSAGARAALVFPTRLTVPVGAARTTGNVMLLRATPGWHDDEEHELRVAVAPLLHYLEETAAAEDAERDWEAATFAELPVALAVLSLDGSILTANDAFLDLVTRPGQIRPEPHAAFDRVGGDTASRLLTTADLVLRGSRATSSGTVRLHGELVEARVLRVETRGPARGVLCLLPRGTDGQSDDPLDFRVARDEGWTRVAYQPIVSPDGTIVGVEALLRFDHPVLGAIRPEACLAVADHQGISHQVDRYVFETVLAAASRLPDSHPGTVLSVNLTPETLLSGAASELVDLIDRSVVPPSRLRIEVVESAALSTTSAIAELRRFRDLGCSVAIDDFGTGYAALAQLSRLPVDVVKLDRRMLHDAQTSKRARIVTEGAVDILHGLDIAVVAEGVETEADRDLARDLGCTAMQGWLFAPALPAKEIVALPRVLAPASRIRS